MTDSSPDTSGPDTSREELRELRESLGAFEAAQRERSEKFSRQLEESRVAQREWSERFSRQLEESRVALREWSERFSRQLEESRVAQRERSAEFSRQLEESESARLKSSAEFTQRMEQISRDHGGFTGNYGEVVEDEFRSAVVEAMRVGDIELDYVYTESLRRKYEFDIVGLNGKYVMVGEIKHRLRLSHVTRFARNRLPFFADTFPEDAKGREVLGMVGGSIIDEDAEEEAKQLGLYILGLRNRKLVVEDSGKVRPIIQKPLEAATE